MAWTDARSPGPPALTEALLLPRHRNSAACKLRRLADQLAPEGREGSSARLIISHWQLPKGAPVNHSKRKRGYSATAHHEPLAGQPGGPGVEPAGELRHRPREHDLQAAQGGEFIRMSTCSMSSCMDGLPPNNNLQLMRGVHAQEFMHGPACRTDRARSLEHLTIRLQADCPLAQPIHLAQAQLGPSQRPPAPASPPTHLECAGQPGREEGAEDAACGNLRANRALCDIPNAAATLSCPSCVCEATLKRLPPLFPASLPKALPALRPKPHLRVAWRWQAVQAPRHVNDGGIPAQQSSDHEPLCFG